MCLSLDHVNKCSGFSNTTNNNAHNSSSTVAMLVLGR